MQRDGVTKEQSNKNTKIRSDNEIWIDRRDKRNIQGLSATLSLRIVVALSLPYLGGYVRNESRELYHSV